MSMLRTKNREKASPTIARSHFSNNQPLVLSFCVCIHRSVCIHCRISSSLHIHSILTSSILGQFDSSLSDSFREILCNVFIRNSMFLFFFNFNFYRITSRELQNLECLCFKNCVCYISHTALNFCRLKRKIHCKSLLSNYETTLIMLFFQI